MSVNQRIFRIIKFYKLNQNSFSKKLGLGNNTTIGNIVAGRKSKPSYAVLELIKKTFPEINMNWLFTGKGRMLEDNPEDLPEALSRSRAHPQKEKAPFELILDEFSIDELITYLHKYEKLREFDKNETYRMFLEIRVQRRIIEENKKNTSEKP